MPEDL